MNDLNNSKIHPLILRYLNVLKIIYSGFELITCGRLSKIKRKPQLVTTAYCGCHEAASFFVAFHFLLLFFKNVQLTINPTILG